ncbi:hypothetical protein B0H16DRAFT_232436 [Mycena metata]|uniref:Uncharacterized protein n=1 Tax=Mycena metata TaxID=1033252 RepID=A0AAD7MR05_9AGAR|nr:hypothetical protein B0H16DRAFT_232436 [Mycena metata]
MLNTEASENWDDDFEFHSNKTTRRPSHASHVSHDTSASSRSGFSAFDDEADADADVFDAHPHDHDPSSSILTTRHHEGGQGQENSQQQEEMHRYSRAPAEQRHREHGHGHEQEQETENWDDDFAEDDDGEEYEPASSPIEDNAEEEEEEEMMTRGANAAGPSSGSGARSHSHANNSNGFPAPPRNAQRTPRASKTRMRNASSGSAMTARPGEDSPSSSRRPSGNHADNAGRMRSSSRASTSSRASRPGSRSSTGNRTPKHRQDGSWSSDEDEDDDEFGAGFGGEEDKTVTARSRKTLAYQLQGSPPPPVPPLPAGAGASSSSNNANGSSMRSAGNLGIGVAIPNGGGSASPFGTMSSVNNHNFGLAHFHSDPMGGTSGFGQPQPFPRSPTASVFSAPGGGGDTASIAYTHTSAGSTTALTGAPGGFNVRGGGSGGRPRNVLVRGLAGLPPSPPIHKERERRRLRKKSRPGNARTVSANSNAASSAEGGVVEMREMGGMRRESSEDMETEEEEDWDAEPEMGMMGGAASSVFAAAGAGEGSTQNNPYGPGAGVLNNSSFSTGAAYSQPSSAHPTSHPHNPYAPQGQGQGQGRVPTPSASQSQVVLGSPGILARIGSVKRWGFGRGEDKGERDGREKEGWRRKKSSSVSVGSVGMGGTTEHDVIQDITAYVHNQRHAHAHFQNDNVLLRTGSHSSSRSRHSYPAQAPPATPPPKSNGNRYSQYTPGTAPQTPPEDPRREKDGRGWFFRGVSGSPGERGRLFRGGGGGGGGVGRDGAAGEGSASTSDVRDVYGQAQEGGRSYTPSPHGGGEKEKEGKEGKTKLVKRRSLGFVQIRRGIRPLNGNAEGERERDQEATPTANNVHPTAVNASPSKGYGILGVGRPSSAAVGSVEDLGRQKEKEREGMGFVERNVRRISLVGAGRHKRTKSGVSISALGISGDEKENDGKAKKGGLVVNPTASPKRTTEGLPPPTPPVDVQLQPPSPPQTVRSASGSTATMKASAPIPIASSRNLDALSTAFSPTFSLASSPASVGLASPISMASSSTPSLTPYPGSTSTSAHTSHHGHSTSPSPKPPLSPNSASLGRSAVINPAVSAAVASPAGAGGVGSMRRNSLGDLKIPARISQAQVGLRRDLSMVREFARNVEELKELQGTYQTLVMEVQGILDMNLLHASQPKEKEKEKERVASPTFFKRHRSNTSSSNPNAPSPQQVQQQAYKQLASAFYGINSKYRISWECAELLIELGGGGSASPPPSTSTSAPAMQSVGGSDGLRKARERAITLQDDTKVPPQPSPAPLTATSSVGAIPVPSPPIASPPSNLAWRASTGRNDLSQRQLLLLKEMLGSPVPGGPDESSFAEDIPEEVMAAAAASTTTVNRDWRWGDAMNSTVTLPSEESGVQGGGKEKEKKRRSSRMRMSGIREMLRSLTKGGVPPVPVSSTSVSTESSGDLNAHLYQHRQVPTTGRQQQRRRAKTSAGPESVRSHHRPLSPFDPHSLKAASPRRPSLASIFRIGKNNKTPPPSAAADVSLDSADGGEDLYPTFSGISGGRESASNSTGDEEEDWDRMEDSASDAEAAAVARRGGSTIRGRSPYLHSSFLAPSAGRPTTPMRSPSGSRTSFQDPTGTAAPPRATRLSNVEEHVDPRAGSKADSPSRQFSRSRRGGKTGSVRSMPPATLPDPKLAMTPENIKPLLENAREVHARLSDCIAEIRSLLVAPP